MHSVDSKVPHIHTTMHTRKHMALSIHHQMYTQFDMHIPLCTLILDIVRGNITTMYTLSSYYTCGNAVHHHYVTTRLQHEHTTM
jgi:hypothetical protein